MNRIEVRQSVVNIKDETAAIEAIASQIGTDGSSLKMLFCSSAYNTHLLGSAIRKFFGDNTIACTTSGEISPLGISKGGIVGASISSSYLKYRNYFIENIQTMTILDAINIGDQFKQDLGIMEFDESKHIGIVIIDGLSMLEDKVIALLSKALSPLTIIGGSAGDDMKFQSTKIYSKGNFESNSALLVLIETELPFVVFKSQHFEPTDKKLVITEADPSKRIVYEINGEKAAIEYANILGLPIDALSPQVFARYPVMLNIGGNWYIRSIAKRNPDDSLTFFCAIDVGLVLTIAKGNDIIQNYRNQFNEIRETIGEPSIILAFDCILRRFEIEQNGLSDELDDLLANQKIIGFNTYGEQCYSVHVNQTLTGVAFGR